MIEVTEMDYHKFKKKDLIERCMILADLEILESKADSKRIEYFVGMTLIDAAKVIEDYRKIESRREDDGK